MIEKGQRMRGLVWGSGHCWILHCAAAEFDGPILLLEFDPPLPGFKHYRDGLCRSCYRRFMENPAFVMPPPPAAPPAATPPDPSPHTPNTPDA